MSIENGTTAGVSKRDAVGFNAHLLFFDRDCDQQISLAETLRGLEQIGLGHVIAWPATVMIHLGISGLSVIRREPFQNPLRLSIPDVGHLRHPDTALVDKNAWFDPSRVDEVFAKHGEQYAGDALTFREIAAMASQRLLRSPSRPVDVLLLPGGALGTAIEWSALFWLAAERVDGRRILTKESVQRFFTDPDFFYDLAARRKTERAERAGSAQGKARNILQTWLL